MVGEQCAGSDHGDEKNRFAAIAARLSAIVASSSDAIFTLDLGGRIVDWNGAAERMFGYPAAELVGQSPSLLAPADRPDESKHILERVIRGEHVADYQTVRVRKDGRRIDVSLSVSPIVDVGGRFLGICKIARDITDHVHAQAVIRDGEDRFRAFMDNSPAVAFMKDPEGRYVFVNAEFRRRIMPSGQVWLGKTNAELFPAEFAAQFDANDRSVLESGEVSECIEMAPDNQGRRTHWLIHKFPIRDHAGRVYLAGQGVDITARLQAEQSVRESRQRLKSALAASRTGTYFVNRRDGLVDFDEELLRLFGCEREDLLTEARWLSRIHASDRDRVADEIHRSLRLQGEFAVDYRIVLKDGSERWIHDKGQPHFDDKGEIDYVTGACVDITQRKLSERAIAESERFATSIVNALTAHVAILDETGRILSVNDAWRRFASENGADPDMVSVGRNYLHVCEATTGPASDDGLQAAEGIRAVMRGERLQFVMEYRCDSPDEKRWYVLRVSRFAGDGPVRVVVAHENVTERRIAEERLRHDSLHDALTGLPNRALLADRIERSLERGKRDARSNVALLFLDLDRFKIINDSLGHVAGDKLLVTIGNRLRQCVRGSDSVGREMRSGDAEDGAVAGCEGTGTIARFGGDEFVVLLEDLACPEDAVRVAERLLAEVSKPLVFDGQEIITTASVGIATACSGSMPTAKDLIRDADMAMYCAKAKGKNQFATFDTSLHASAITRLRLESDLRHALERHELLLHYQPIVALDSRELLGFEALIRWRRDGKLISPADFIPIAEDTGLIVPIGRWVLEESCRQLAAWRAKYPVLRHLYMSVNVSRRQLNDPGLIAHVAGTCRETGMAPADLRLEITESVVMEDSGAAKEILDELKRVGVLLSMDDFGTGYSSLSCLHKFPIDVLKIDRSFVADLAIQSDTAAVIGAVVTLARQLEISVVAEGLETPEQVEFLRGLGCDSGQGYLFGKPMAAEHAEQFARARATNAAAA